MGDGGGFPQVRAVVRLVNPELPVACPSIKGAPKNELTNLLVGWMQIRVSNQKLVTLPSPILELQHAPLYPFQCCELRSALRAPNISVVWST
jgi:hypothetical protein